MPLCVIYAYVTTSRQQTNWMATIVTRRVKKVGILLQAYRHNLTKKIQDKHWQVWHQHTPGEAMCVFNVQFYSCLLFQITGTPDTPSITDSSTWFFMYVQAHGTRQTRDHRTFRTSGYTCFRNCRHTNHMLNRTVTIFILGLLYTVLDTRGLWHSSCYSSSASRSHQATDGKSGRSIPTQFTNDFIAFLHKLLVLLVLLYSKEPVR
jgi:hypothetical protein